MTRQNPLFKAYVALAMVCFFWGTTYLAIRIGVQFVPGFMMAGIRNVLAGLLTCGFFLISGYSFPQRKLWKILLIRSILLIVLGNAMVHWAEEQVESGLAAIIAAMVPIWVAAISIVGFKSIRPNFRSSVGLALGFIGIILIFYTNNSNLFAAGSLLGIIAMFTASFGWSLGTVYSSVNKIDIPPIFAAGIQMLLGGIISIFISISIGEEFNIMEVQWQGWMAILYLVIFGSILSYNAYQYALSKLPAAQVGIYAYINPVVAVLLGWLVLAERMDWWIAVGIVITLYGVYMVNRGFSIKALAGKQ